MVAAGLQRDTHSEDSGRPPHMRAPAATPANDGAGAFKAWRRRNLEAGGVRRRAFRVVAGVLRLVPTDRGLNWKKLALRLQYGVPAMPPTPGTWLHRGKWSHGPRPDSCGAALRGARDSSYQSPAAEKSR